MFDPWLLALATPRPVRYMAKAELWRIPLVGRALDAFGTFPVERGTGDGTAMSRAASLLHEGEVIGIFPQGTSKQLPNRPFHRGAARLALATGAPIVPVRLVGTRGFLPAGPRRPTEVHVGEPIVVEQAKPTVAAARALTARVEQALTDAGMIESRWQLWLLCWAAAALAARRPLPRAAPHARRDRGRRRLGGEPRLIAALAAILGPGELEHRLLILVLAGLENLRIASLVRGRLGKGEDTRYQELRRRWAERGREQLTFAIFYQAQALVAALLAIPFVLIAFNDEPGWRPWSGRASCSGSSPRRSRRSPTGS